MNTYDIAVTKDDKDNGGRILKRCGVTEETKIILECLALMLSNDKVKFDVIDSKYITGFLTSSQNPHTKKEVL